jgi:hypothetical protein
MGASFNWRTRSVIQSAMAARLAILNSRAFASIRGSSFFGFTLRPKHRQLVPVRIIEIGRPQGAGDSSWFVSELDAARGQRLVRPANVFHGENDLDGPCDRPPGPGERLAQAKGDASAIQKSEALILAFQHQAQLVAVERYRARQLLHAEHHHADLSELEI